MPNTCFKNFTFNLYSSQETEFFSNICLKNAFTSITTHLCIWKYCLIHFLILKIAIFTAHRKKNFTKIFCVQNTLWSFFQCKFQACPFKTFELLLLYKRKVYAKNCNSIGFIKIKKQYFVKIIKTLF